MENFKLETKNVSIEFPGVKALDSVDFSISAGEIHAVVGANGAGKSTLMKVLAGSNPTYTGDIYLNGEKIELRSPLDAMKLGIQIVYQEVDAALYSTLSVAENIVQTDMVMNNTGYFVNWSDVYKEGRKALDRLKISREDIDERELVGNLSLAQKQMVLIAKAMRSQCNLLILDEPTAPLSDTETEKLFSLIKHLHATEPVAILYISHRINEILEICQNYTVMRNGKVVCSEKITPDTTVNRIVELMLGRSFEENFPKELVNIGEPLLEVNHLSDEDNHVKDVSFTVRKGEIVGIAGLVGAGKSELCKTLFGAYPKKYGEIKLRDDLLQIKSPSDAVKSRIALVPEERRKEGVLVEEDVSFNLSAVSLPQFTRLSFVNKKKVADNAKHYIEELEIKTPSHTQLVRNLSGGNQQKVSVGKWLSADCDIYIFDEPTKGVDVGAKQDIFRLINDIAKAGNGVIYASCENNELLSLTDRIYVMYNGEVMAELKTSETNEEEIMHYAVGDRNHVAAVKHEEI